MASQKPLKTAIGQLSLAYNQAVMLLDTDDGGFLRPSHNYEIKFLHRDRAS
jgi:hypothetical protein